MAKLSNPKHEEFALLIAKGVKQGQAYVKAGYTKNDAAASRLKKDPKIVDRVEELKIEIATQIKEVVHTPSPEGWKTLKDMGIDQQWIVTQYKEIYTQSLRVGQFGPANTAINNIQKLWEVETKGDKGDETPTDNKIDINAIGDVLDKVADIVSAAKLPNAPEPVPEMIDITPEETS